MKKVQYTCQERLMTFLNLKIYHLIVMNESSSIAGFSVQS